MCCILSGWVLHGWFNTATSFLPGMRAEWRAKLPPHIKLFCHEICPYVLLIWLWLQIRVRNRKFVLLGMFSLQKVHKMLHIWLHIHLQSCALLRVPSCQEKVGDLGGPLVLSLTVGQGDMGTCLTGKSRACCRPSEMMTVPVASAVKPSNVQ